MSEQTAEDRRVAIDELHRVEGQTNSVTVRFESRYPSNDQVMRRAVEIPAEEWHEWGEPDTIRLAIEPA